MEFTLTAEEQTAREEFRAWVAAKVLPFASDWDRAQRIPREVIADLAARGYLGATLGAEHGGRGLDQITHGLLLEEIGRGCASLRTLLTVHTCLIAETLARWGSEELKARWLRAFATGEKIAVFALSEPATGSDAPSIVSTYTEVDGGFELNGVKHWTSFGQIADVFLTFARGPAGVSAFLVERERAGVEVRPVTGILGTRASLIAEVHFTSCRIPSANAVGRPGWGFLQIANTALDNGRYSVACGCLGLIRACLEDSVAYAERRQQFGKTLSQHQLIQRRLTKMTTAAHAVQLLCRQAGRARDGGDPGAALLTTIAKYVAAEAACEAADHAVQIHGALGCHDSLPIERYYRDARIMEIVEGSTEMQEIMIAGQARASLHHLSQS